jgi:hypothetical protein
MTHECLPWEAYYYTPVEDKTKDDQKGEERAVQLPLVEDFSPVLVTAEDSQYHEGSYFMQYN